MIIELLPYLAIVYVAAGALNVLSWALANPAPDATPRTVARIIVIWAAGFLPWLNPIWCAVRDTALALPLEWQAHYGRKSIASSLAELQELTKSAYSGVDADEYVNAIRGR